MPRESKMSDDTTKLGDDEPTPETPVAGGEFSEADQAEAAEAEAAAAEEFFDEAEEYFD